MTVDAVTPTEGRLTRARRAFRRWRKRRPFWGGLLLMLAGLELLYSGNLSLGNIQVHLGLIGFKSYIIPLVVILCGALAWATPSQRLFYGIIGTAAVVYSVVSVNLGGFLIGLLLGMFGGALTIAWVPNKRAMFGRARGDGDGDADDGAAGDAPDGAVPSAGDGTAAADGTAAGDATADLGAPSPTQPATDVTAWARPDADEQKPEGEQRHPFRRHRYPVDGTNDRADDNDGRRTLAIIVVALTLAASAGLAARYAEPAAADTCTPTPLQSAIAKAVGASTASNGTATNSIASNTAAKRTSTARGGTLTGAGGTNSRTTGGAARSGAGASSNTAIPGANTTTAGGSAPSAAPAAAAAPAKQVASVIGGVGGLVGALLDTPSAPPSASPSNPPMSGPPAPTPTTAPSPVPTSTRTVRPSPSASPTSGDTPTRPAPTATAPTSPPPLCTVTPNQLSAAAGQPPVNLLPSTLKAATLSMSGLSYDGNVELPTANGTILAMQFSMTSSTATPFELDVPVGDHQIVITSSSLTVSGDVKFYATEIKGNLDGTVPIDFTPSAPPPLTVPDLFFTDATVSLAFVSSTTLTAANLGTSPT